MVTRDITGLNLYALSSRAEYLPVLVEAPLALLSDVLGPDGLKGAEAPGGGDISDNTDHYDGRGLDDGDALDNLLLVDLGARSVHLADNVGHTSLVAHEAGHVNGLAGVILGEGLDPTPEGLGSLLREEPLGSVSWRLKLSVRLK